MEPEETLATIPEEEEDDDDAAMPDVKNNPKTTTKDNSWDSNDGSDSDFDSEDEAKQNVELQTLEYQLSNEPSNYDTHVQYIKVLRKMGEIEKLRQAREAMNEIFPLTPTMWQEWARDEASISTGPQAHLAVEKIYERGVSDYLIYLKYEQSSGDPARVQLLYERAITDFPVSSDLWLDYTRYLDKTLKVGNVVRDVYSRATNNCPWVGELWVFEK